MSGYRGCGCVWVPPHVLASIDTGISAGTRLWPVALQFGIIQTVDQLAHLRPDLGLHVLANLIVPAVEPAHVQVAQAGRGRDVGLARLALLQVLGRHVGRDDARLFQRVDLPAEIDVDERERREVLRDGALEARLPLIEAVGCRLPVLPIVPESLDGGASVLQELCNVLAQLDQLQTSHRQSRLTASISFSFRIRSSESSFTPFWLPPIAPGELSSISSISFQAAHIMSDEERFQATLDYLTGSGSFSSSGTCLLKFGCAVMQLIGAEV